MDVRNKSAEAVAEEVYWLRNSHGRGEVRRSPNGNPNGCSSSTCGALGLAVVPWKMGVTMLHMLRRRSV